MFFLVRISYILGFISINDLLTDHPSYIMTPELILLAYLINSSQQSSCLCLYPPVVARQQLGKNPSHVAIKPLGKNITAATNIHVTIEEWLDASFTVRSMSY
jgi:hypothetical protein